MSTAAQELLDLAYQLTSAGKTPLEVRRAILEESRQHVTSARDAAEIAHKVLAGLLRFVSEEREADRDHIRVPLRFAAALLECYVMRLSDDRIHGDVEAAMAQQEQERRFLDDLRRGSEPRSDG